MASPGTLRLTADLADREIEEISPVVDDDSGRVSYPAAEERIDPADQPLSDLLTKLSTRGILDHEFQRKSYICPNCNQEGLRYASVCPSCHSEHMVPEDQFEHSCGYRGTERSFRNESGEFEYECPSCGVSLASLDELSHWEGYICNGCGDTEDEPTAGLWCSDCTVVCSPREIVEKPLYSYTLSTDGKRWLAEQLGAREAIVDQLEDRGMIVEVDVSLDESADGPVVHILARDELFDESVVVGITDQPLNGDIERIRELASLIDARPIQITVTGEVTEQAAELADRVGVRILSYEGDGELSQNYETTQVEGTAPMIERLTTSFRQRFT